MLTLFIDLQNKNGMLKKTFFCPECGEKIEYWDSIDKAVSTTSPIACASCFCLLPRVSYIEKEEKSRHNFHLKGTT